MELKIDNASIETLVKSQISVAVAALLSQKSDYLVSQLVKHALEAKDSSYDRETILDKRINALIREEATAGMKEWLDSKRADIRKQIFAALAKKSDGLVASIVDKLVLSMTRLDVNAYLSRGE